MSDYIKREDAVERVAYELMYEVAIDKGLTYKEFIELEAKKQEGIKLQVRKWLEQVSSADVVEVKHGHWDFYGLIDDIYGHGASCSVCGGYSEDNGYYCSCCGAKMDDALQRKTNPEAFTNYALERH